VQVIRFADKERHSIWLEPEGLSTHTVYPSGLNTAFPEEVQLDLLRSIPGLARVDMIRPGYAVEYEVVDSRSVLPSLESRLVRGLYLAGQILGTTGYEEAGAQGIMAGINAGLAAARGAPPLLLQRTDAFIGVLLDDLTSATGRTGEPYRMFTSRAEFRLSLRAENADMRLTRRGHEAGVVSRERFEHFCERERLARKGLQRLAAFTLPAGRWTQLLGARVSEEHRARSAEEVLAMPEATVERLEGIMRSERRRQRRELAGKGHGEAAAPPGTAEGVETAALADTGDAAPTSPSLPPAEAASAPAAAVVDADVDADDADDAAVTVAVHPRVREHVEVLVKYRGYLEKQAKEMASFRAGDATPIPPDLDWGSLSGVSREEADLLSAARPVSIHAASRIAGVRPSTLMLLFQLSRRAALAQERREARGGGVDGRQLKATAGAMT
jgi:tRNA U34 5-carboxymethylaminomethyl modifying enzyme MnmG/GidA